ncbi:MAG: response regulator [Pseudomonadota bacterium]
MSPDDPTFADFDAMLSTMDTASGECWLKLEELRGKVDEGCDRGVIHLAQWRLLVIRIVEMQSRCRRGEVVSDVSVSTSVARKFNASILVIEDNGLTMDMMIFVLMAMGYRVIPALNGPVGLSIARAERPQLIFCDICMPELDGYGVVKALRADPDPSVSGIPVIAVTASLAEDQVALLLAAGFSAYLPKPLDLDQLNAALRQHLATAPGSV